MDKSMGSAAISIIKLAEKDFEEWFELWGAYQVFYKAAIPDEVSRLTWGRILEGGGTFYGAAAFHGGGMTGIVHSIFHPSTWAATDYCYLHDLYVKEDERGGGTGAALIDRIHDLARARNCARLHGTTHETNTTARGLYDKVAERSGFIQYRKALVPRG